jgi:hypothetical protein
MSPKEQNREPEVAHRVTIEVVGCFTFLVNERVERLEQRKGSVSEEKI